MKTKSVPIILITISVLLASCASDDVTTPLGTFITVVNGDSLELQDGEVFIKSDNGAKYSQEITGLIISDETITNSLKIVYVGELSTDNSDNSYRIIGGIYYENDFRDSWSCFCRDINLVITRLNNNRVWGYVEDFEATGKLGTVTITGTKFEGIPVDVINIKRPTGSVD